MSKFRPGEIVIVKHDQHPVRLFGKRKPGGYLDAIGHSSNPWFWEGELRKLNSKERGENGKAISNNRG